MPGGETIMISKDELDARISAGVEKKRLDILIDDFRDHKQDEEKSLHSINKNIADIFNLIRNFPSEVDDCRDKLEKDISDDLERHYVTKTDLSVIKNDIANIRRGYKWTTTIIVFIAGAIQFVTTMWYMSLQIAKLTTGAG